MVNELARTVKSRHVERLKNGICTIELGFILSDLINNYQRIADHCSNIAIAIIEVNRGSFDTHGYIIDIKESKDGDYTNMYNEYRKRMPSGKTEQNFFETSMTKIIGVFVLQIFCGTVTDIINRQ